MRMSNKIWLRWIAILLTANVGLVGCVPLTDVSSLLGSKPTPVPTATPFVLAATPDAVLPYLPYQYILPSNWLFESVKNNNCSGTCWQGIIPNITTLTETISLLNKHSQHIENLETITETKPYPRTFTRWRWAGEIGFGFILYEPTTSGVLVVENVKLVAPKMFKLEDIIKIFGTPTKVLVSPIVGLDVPVIPDEVRYTTTVINENMGYAFSNISQLTVDLSPQTGFYIVWFFNTKNKANLTTIVSDDDDFLLDWQGYKNDSFYCREAYITDKEPCRIFAKVQPTP